MWLMVVSYKKIVTWQNSKTSWLAGLRLTHLTLTLTFRRRNMKPTYLFLYLGATQTIITCSTA